MSQVIEVRLLNPDTMEVIGNEFTQADSHIHAIDLALWFWSNGLAVLKGIERTEDEQGKWVTKGGPAWKYIYHITLEDEDGVGERHALAVLFTQYKQKEA